MSAQYGVGAAGDSRTGGGEVGEARSTHMQANGLFSALVALERVLEKIAKCPAYQANMMGFAITPVSRHISLIHQPDTTYQAKSNM